MRVPILALNQHLMWTRQGTIWATWRIQGLARGFGGGKTYGWSRAHHQDLFQSILGEALILGLTADIEPEVIVNKMLEGVNITEHTGWAEEALLTVDALRERPLGTREYWLAVPLRSGNVVEQLKAFRRTTEATTLDLLALGPRRPSEREIEDALQAAGRIEEAIPAAFQPTRATASEQLWMFGHAMQRGLSLDNGAPAPTGVRGGVAHQFHDGARRTQGTNGAIFPNPFFDEGGKTDPKRITEKLNPLTQRFLKVINPREDTTSYQVMLALAGTPKGGWESPGVEWMQRLDELGVDADWALRLNIVRASVALRRNARAEANITDQLEQRSGTQTITGSGSEMEDSAATLQEYVRELNRTEKEVEIQTTLIVAVGGETADDARRKANFIAKDFKGMEFIFESPYGAQEALWWGMLPGVPTDRVIREFTEITTSRNFASLIPCTSSELGDDQGIYFADNITSGTNRPVFLDLHGQVRSDISAAVAICAEPGAGKSVALKGIVGDNHDRGGRAVIIDRTASREYGKFARSLDPDRTTIVDIVNPAFSLDPLRVFGARTGASHMQGLLSSLLGVPARSPGGVMLSELLEPEYAVANGLHDAGALLQHVRVLGEKDAEAKNLAGLMGLYANKEYGAVLFDATLPPLDVDSNTIVFLTHGLELPDEHELLNDKMNAEMSLPKLFGHAMYALLMSLAREVCFANPDELALLVIDEVKHVTDSIVGCRELSVFLLDGRKHGAPLCIAGQDCHHFGPAELRGMIKNRVLMRQTDIGLAKGNLEWFEEGFSNNDNLVHLVTKELSPLGNDGKVPLERRGEGLMRDARGRMGKIRKTLSLRPHRREATLTTPQTLEHALHLEGAAS